MSVLLKNKIALFSFIFILLLLVLILLSYMGYSFDKYSFDAQDQDLILSSPSLEHPLGTDQLGRDLLARLIYGARLSILVAVVTALIAFFIGLLVGTIAAMCEGKIDFFITRLIDIVYSLPDLLILSIVGLLFSRSTSGILFAIGLISWMDVARLTRAEILKLKQHEYILSARAIGLTDTRIFFKHLLPNILSVLLVTITFTMPRAIIAESTLSFLGLGLSPPNCSWGTLASDGWQFLNTHTNLILYPSLMIMLTVLSLNIIGDFLTELNQPRKSYI
ncbi:MAG: ABC transporter permease [Candidatus Melainabacteria bacterium]|nr:ABC transporter permease [Candidatus Melainabacteria bacterium]